TTEIYTLSLHDALPIARDRAGDDQASRDSRTKARAGPGLALGGQVGLPRGVASGLDRQWVEVGDLGSLGHGSGLPVNRIGAVEVQRDSAEGAKGKAGRQARIPPTRVCGED